MTREQIDEACTHWICSQENGTVIMARNVWRAAVEWAYSHPQWHDAQGDNVPEYGREVIVIRRNGMICYGHRPNPKEYVIVEGKKCFAKTYDKNDWNIPDIALWLDVEVPHELVDKIVTEYFKENKLPPRKEE